MKSLLKKLGKTLLIFLGVIVSLIGIYIIFNLNLFHSPKVLSQNEMDKLIQNADTSNVYQFVADKFDKYDVVWLGEIHKRKQDLDFLAELIPYLHKTKNINIIGWEFGAEEDQKATDSLLTAPAFDRRKAIYILRKAMVYWSYEEYLHIFEVVWKINQGIPEPENKIRFLQLNGLYVPRTWNDPDTSISFPARRQNIDMTLPGIVEREVLQKNKKILIYTGLHHAFTKYQMPVAFFIKSKDPRAGQRLYSKYPDKIYQITLVSPVPFRWLLYYYAQKEEDKIKMIYPFDAVFNQMYDKIGKPFAVAADNPVFGDIRDYDSFYAFDRFNGLPLREFTDACIMHTAFDKIEPIHAIEDWVTTPEEMNQVKQVLPVADTAGIRTPADMMRHLSPEGDINGMRQFHKQKKFW